MIMLRTRECVCERETENPTIENCLFNFYYFFCFFGTLLDKCNVICHSVNHFEAFEWFLCFLHPYVMCVYVWREENSKKAAKSQQQHNYSKQYIFILTIIHPDCYR